MTIGQRIKARRTKLGISRASLARKIGISQVGLYFIEIGRTEWPGSGLIAPIADALHTTTDYLLRDQTEQAET